MTFLTPDQEQRLAANLFAAMQEQDRLRALSPRELVLETLTRDAADDPHVTELMDRVFPGWVDEVTEEELS